MNGILAKVSWRNVAAAISMIVMTSNSTSTSALFVAYRHYWGLTPADIGLAFSIYVGTLVPVLLIFGGVAERFGRRLVVVIGMLFMIAGTAVLVGAHGLMLLIVARMLQGVGAALAVGSISATFTESYRGKIAAGQALAVVTAVALSAGPVITAVAYDLGGGPNLSYLPMLSLGILTLGLTPIFATRSDGRQSASAAEVPMADKAVWLALRFAMPVVFIAWAGTSLYLSLVPAYLAVSLHASDPLIGAGAFLATQLATVFASIRFGNAPPERSGIVASIFMIVGLALLVAGTRSNLWSLIVVATIVVGAGSGVASGASFAIAARVGRGQRARIFARLLVAAYLGYSVPVLVTGFVAAHSTFTAAFVVDIVGLLAIAAALPFLRERPCPQLVVGAKLS
jgi:hypothetical protein